VLGKKLPWAWGQEDTTAWEFNAPTKISFKFNKDLEWEFQICILGFGIFVLRQWDY
jgi:hypothetical protein